jgi:hypothetical protein
MRRTSLPFRNARAIPVVVGVIAAGALVAQAGFGAFGSGARPRAPLISSAPLRPTVSTRATVAFDRIPGLAHDCALDGGAYRRCPSPVTFTSLTRSIHVVRVRARSSTGKTSAPSAYSWKVVPRRARPLARDRVRPLLTTAPVRPWISRNATFAWLLRRSAKAECRLDRGAWKPCTNPKSYPGLRLGTHVFRLRAKRPNGSRSKVNRFAWTIVSSPRPPPPAIWSRPDSDTAATDASFDFEVAARSSAECQLDANDWTPCDSAAVYVGLALGRHTFCVRAIGTGGGVGPKACVSWDVLPSLPFPISGRLSGLLFPGAERQLELTVTNPFDFDLRVTSLTVNVRPGSSQAGCDGPANLRVIQSNSAGGTVSVVVPARGSVTLPDQSATTPRVTMLDLPVSQDACKNAVFTFDYSGVATRT